MTNWSKNVSLFKFHFVTHLNALLNFNSFYFSPTIIGEYVVELSIETSSRELIINEFFIFDAVEELPESEKTFTNIKFPSDINISNIAYYKLN